MVGMCVWVDRWMDGGVVWRLVSTRRCKQWQAVEKMGRNGTVCGGGVNGGEWGEGRTLSAAATPCP